MREVTTKEKWGYAMYGFIGAIAVAPAQFFQIFLTEDQKIGAAYLGTVLLVTRLIDFFISFIVGGIVESVRFKEGRYRPWLSITQYIIYVGIFIQFFPFEIPLPLRTVFIVLGYLMVNTSSSFRVVAQYGTLTLLSGPSMANRNNTNILAVRVSTVATLITAATTAPVRNFLNGLSFVGTKYRYIVMSMVYGLLYFVATMILRAVAKPYDAPMPAETAGQPRKKISAAEMFKCVVTNDQLLIYLVGSTLYFVGTLAPATLVTYYFIYIQNDPKLLGYTLSTTVTRFFSLLTTMVGPAVGLKLGRRKARAVGQFVSGISALGIIFLGGRNVWFYTGSMMLQGLAASLYSGFGVSYPIDCGEYGFWKTGIDNRIVTNSLANIPMKVSQLVGGTLALYGLAAIGWKTGMTVDAAFTTRFMWLMGGIPAASFFIASATTVFFYKIDDEQAALYARENAERVAAQKAAAEAANPATD